MHIIMIMFSILVFGWIWDLLLTGGRGGFIVFAFHPTTLHFLTQPYFHITCPYQFTEYSEPCIQGYVSSMQFHGSGRVECKSRGDDVTRS